MPPRSRTSAVARAAADLLKDRIRFIEDLEAAATDESAALTAVEEAQRRAADAANRTITTHRAAVDAGWTPNELRQLGYGDRRSARRATPPKPSGEAADIESVAEPEVAATSGPPPAP